MSFVQTLVAFLVALGVLVFIHELGHYLVARWCGVKVLRFSVGFGKPLVRWVVGPDKTEWTLSPIPLGGFVRMLDERDPTQLPISAQDLPRAFTRQTVGRRMLIVLAGPVANFLLAIGLYAVLAWSGTSQPSPILDEPASQSAASTAGFLVGDKVTRVNGSTVNSWESFRLELLDAVVDHAPADIEVQRNGQLVNLKLATKGLPEGEIDKDFMGLLGLGLAGTRPEIGTIEPGSPADRAGLMVGDSIVSVGGETSKRVSQVIQQIRKSPEQPLVFEVQRDKAILAIKVTPARKEETGPASAGSASVAFGRIGAALRSNVQLVTIQHGPIDGLVEGVRQTWTMSAFSLRMMGKMLLGEVSWRNLSGPVTIADYAGKAARINWQAYIHFLALISVSLGVLNLLPIPVLDGGHLVYYGIEGIRGRPLSERVIELTQRIGVGLIGAMMVVALFNDLTRVFGS